MCALCTWSEEAEIDFTHNLNQVLFTQTIFRDGLSYMQLFSLSSANTIRPGPYRKDTNISAISRAADVQQCYTVY